jgi:ABC-type bacteriocin/lantibiotic exporter with double-glycine peptidase domain
MPRKLASAALSVVAIFACVAAVAEGTASLWLDVPFVRQQKDGCGPASIAMVMQYWARHQGRPAGPNADPARIFPVLYSASAHGVYASAMVSYFEQNGYRAFAFAGQFSDLEHHLALGRPLIAALKPGSGAELHYVVVAGLDEPRHLVLVNDPAQRKLLSEEQSQFEREWKAAGYWLLLAVPETSAH